MLMFKCWFQMYVASESMTASEITGNHLNYIFIELYVYTIPYLDFFFIAKRKLLILILYCALPTF